MLSENFICSTLFENIEIYLNHELSEYKGFQLTAHITVIIIVVTTKSSDSDYFLTDFVFLRAGYNSGII